jgi:Protein of unknown function (DUF1018)
VTEELRRARSSPSTRARDIKTIHGLRRRLGMCDDDARALQAQITGCASSADMQPAQRARVIAHLTDLVRRSGQTVKTKPTLSRQQWLIQRMWRELHERGVVRDGSDAALSSFIKAAASVDALRFVRPMAGRNIIEALKQMGARANKVKPL